MKVPIRLITEAEAEFEAPPAPAVGEIWYANSQGPVCTSGPADIAVPASGNYIFTYLNIPTSGDRRIMLSSDFVVSVENSGSGVLDVWAQIGVSGPSEDEYPLRPFHGVMHSVSRVRIPPNSMSVLNIIRLDVIGTSQLPVQMPWTLAKNAQGQYPRLAPQVFAPAGTRVCNCAVRVVQIG